MRIIVFGGEGKVGRTAVAELTQRHEVITIGRSRGDFQGDVGNIESLKSLFERVGGFDALISCVGTVTFKAREYMSQDDWHLGIQDKLMGQVNLVQIGVSYANPNASFTLTSGVLNRDPIRTGSSAAMINGALEGWVTAAAQEMPPGMRLNIVSPGLLEGAVDVYGPYFRGFQPVPDQRVGLAYARCAEGLIHGQTLLVH